jgi:hypothetical protein
MDCGHEKSGSQARRQEDKQTDRQACSATTWFIAASLLLLYKLCRSKPALLPSFRYYSTRQSVVEAPADQLSLLLATNRVPMFANNAIDWWLGQRTSSGKRQPGQVEGLIAAQVGTRVR